MTMDRYPSAAHNRNRDAGVVGGIVGYQWLAQLSHSPRLSPDRSLIRSVASDLNPYAPRTLSKPSSSTHDGCAVCAYQLGRAATHEIQHILENGDVR